jgi:tetratricopeptide (TPR) repeat protein
VIGLRRQFLAIAANLFRRRGGQSAVGYVRESGRLLNEALLAQQEKRWPDAVQLWHEYTALVPSDIRGFINLGNSLLALDRLADAAACAQTTLAKWPARAEGAVLSARVASREQSAEERVALWQPVVSAFPANATAREELGRALLDAGHTQEASAVADRLQVLDRRAAKRLRGNILAAAQNSAELQLFWQEAAREFPEDPDFLRKAIDAGLRAGSAAAVSDFDALLAMNRARLSDVNFAIGVANLLRAEKNAAGLRHATRRYLKSQRDGADYRLAALKLSRILFREFPDKPVDMGTAPERFATMLDRAAISANVRNFWRDTDALYAQMRSASPLSLMETDISKEQCEAFVALVRQKLTDGAPFSFIRLGDAESNALHYEAHLTQFFDADTRERELSWWGQELSADQRSTLNRNVNTAIWSVDALGVPGAARILRDMDLTSDRVLESGRTARGHRAVLNAVRERLQSNGPVPLFVSANLHQDLYRFDLYKKLLQGTRDVVCVTAHTNLPERLVSDFGVVSATNLTLRSAKSVSHLVDQNSNAFVLPGQSDDVLSAMDRDLKGRLVIVCGGYVGKWICHQAAQRGAVALDLGSIADYWMGARTRGYLELV